MTPAQAKEILLLHRPGQSEGEREDPLLAEALEMARQDPELLRWHEEHRAFDEAMRSRFAAIEVPAGAKAKLKLLEPQKILRPRPWFHHPVLWAAAAAVVAVISLTALWVKPRTLNRFADYQGRMVRTVLREYRMEIVTNDMSEVRKFMAERGAPADYIVPTGLKQRQLTGGGLLRWRNKSVAMVCFNRGDNEMLYLFVVNDSAVKDPPPMKPAVNDVSKLVAASWRSDGKTYMLAGPKEADFLQKYLGN